MRSVWFRNIFIVFIPMGSQFDLASNAQYYAFQIISCLGNETAPKPCPLGTANSDTGATNSSFCRVRLLCLH